MSRLVLAALLLAAGAAAPGAEPLGRSSLAGSVAVGEVFSFELPCNPTTGFRWELTRLSGPAAAPLGPVRFVKDAAPRGKAGAGGVCVLGLKGVEPGKATAFLSYRRPWEKKPPAKTARVELTVLPARAP